MKVARIIFGSIYLLGAIFNIYLVTTQGWEAHIPFAEDTFWPAYRDAWVAIAVPNIEIVVSLLILFEICLGLLFILSRRYLKSAFILGIIFCLASMPAMLEAIYTNLPLAVIQALLLWRLHR